MYIKLGRMSSPDEDLVRAEVLLQDATVFVIFAGRETRWPFRVENRTDIDIDIWQQVQGRVGTRVISLCSCSCTNREPKRDIRFPKRKVELTRGTTHPLHEKC